MTIKKPENMNDFQAVNKTLQDFYNNISLEDMRAGNIRTEVPTAQTLDKGRFAFAEISGVPTYYYRGTDGNIYKVFEGTVI